MTDATLARLVDFAGAGRFEALGAAAVHEAKRRLIDAIASGLGAWNAPLAGMARQVAGRVRGDPAATVWGGQRATSPELAAFANAVMVRLLDISDTYLGASRGHPSDMIPGLVALAEVARADGRTLLAAIAAAYDVYCSFCDAADVNARGWDQPVYGVLGCAIGGARVLGLDAARTGHAVGLALAPNLALAQARRGHLSSWKGCAGANATRNAVFATQLARDGFTGPEAVFEGDGGLYQAIGGIDWRLPQHGETLARTHLKTLPVCYHGQAAVEAALGLREGLDAAAVEAVEVATYRNAVLMMGADPSRWAPQTRETADHSLPWCVAVALLDGRLDDASFPPARLGDPRVRQLMARVRVDEDPQLTARYPEAAPGRVTLRMRSGEVRSAQVEHPRGHARRPLTDAQLEAKFRDGCAALLGEEGCRAVLETVWKLDTSRDVAGDLVARLARAG